MRKLIVEEWISLDGHTTDLEGKLDFFAHTVRDFYTSDENKNFLETIDCILFGRKTYEQFAVLWPERSTEGDMLSKKMNSSEKIVFSKSMAKAPWGKWNEAKVEKQDPAFCIKQLKGALGKKNIVVWGSVSLVQLLMKEKLVDVYRLHVCPTITGGGRKLFPDDGLPAHLTLMDTRQYASGGVSLNYSVNQ